MQIFFPVLGQTAHTIQKHEEFVKTLWADLKRKSSRKQHKLKDSIAFHKLNIAVSKFYLSLDDEYFMTKIKKGLQSMLVTHSF